VNSTGGRKKILQRDVPNCPHRILSLQSNEHVHQGVDFSVCEGEYIVSSTEGKVVAVVDAAPDTTGGVIAIEHNLSATNQTLAYYVHFEKILVTNGAQVHRGTILGTVWRPNSAIKWIPHVHFELHNDPTGNAMDVLKILRGCKTAVNSPDPIYPVSC
jgi:murein DD-endopeptidase MepM/ murein hydrolase activator NlpD